MTIMLKKGKKALLDDLKNNISYQGVYALNSVITNHAMSRSYDKMFVAIHNSSYGSSNGRSIEMIQFLEDFSRRFSENLATAILTTLDSHLYTQEEMEKDLGLHK
jgi:hypothetical protein